MQQPYSICVFCGASPHVPQKYLTQAALLGTLIAKNHYRLVYGGGSSGLMGIVSNSAMTNGGEVLGIYPEFFRPENNSIPSVEPANSNLTELIYVEDLSVRKTMMLKKSDCFVILPGGFGTLDEAFEVITWKYLNKANYPIIFYNQDGFYDELFKMSETIYETKFANREVQASYNIVNNLEEIFELIKLHENSLEKA